MILIINFFLLDKIKIKLTYFALNLFPAQVHLYFSLFIFLNLLSHYTEVSFYIEKNHFDREKDNSDSRKGFWDALGIS